MENFLEFVLKILRAFIPSRMKRTELSAFFYYVVYGYMDVIKKHKDFFLKSFTYKEDKNKNFDVDLSIVVIMKNEGCYLKEWIEYHKMLGVERFYVYDNESTDNTKQILEPYIASGDVIYEYVKGKAMQLPTYQKAIDDHKYESRYMAFIDCDEFIVPKTRDTILEVINDIEKETKKTLYGLAINWKNFGYNSHYSKPDRLVTESYLKCEDKYQVKSIINPRVYYVARTPHNFTSLVGKYTRDQKGKLAIGQQHYTPSYDKIQINHYFTKSYEEFIAKIKRGSSECGKVVYSIPEYDENYLSKNYDDAILRFVPKLKKALELSEQKV